MPFLTDPDAGDEPTLEPIAICGMGCRLPGNVDSPSSLWDLLIKKGSGSSPKVPKSRFNIDAHYHPNNERPGSFNVLGGYFLDGRAEDFDPTFFNMTPIEAMWLDPQQRKILEVCYEAIESAGLTLDSLAGSNTAVYVGSFTADYQQMTFKDPDFRHSYAATGVDPGIISNRIGNVFDLKGPSFTINTACSSSVYAIHNACHALRARDCEAALVGGVNLILTVDQHMNTAKLGVLSPTSFCHTFDEVADGYGRGEGAGALFLKRLSDAVRDGDVIRSVIRSSATNTNGKVPGYGITYPNRNGQEMVIRSAYQRAHLDPNMTAYFECHGTGTSVGDPIEVRAVSAAMNDTRPPQKPLLVGAVKPNIGHSEAASGVFAVMKAALMTETGVVPGVAGLKRVNPLIPEAQLNIKVNKDTSSWPQGFDIRRASVSSFGYGGTNGHVIVEDVHALVPRYHHGAHRDVAPYDHSSTRPLLVTMSAHDKTTLTRNIEAHRQVVSRYFLTDFAHTLNHRRTRFGSRAYTVATEGSQDEDMETSSFKFGTKRHSVPDLAFMFTGQGAQWASVGQYAIEAFPTFKSTVEELDAVLQQLEHPPDFSLVQELSAPPETSRINDANVAQPTLVGIQIAIVDLLASWGISPTATVGHSAGEYAAAYAAGIASAPEIIIAAYYRGYAIKHYAPAGGTMLAVGKGPDEVKEFVPNLGQDIVVACENSPSSVTLSGTLVSVHEAKKVFDAQKIFARELKTGMAYHSPQMATVATPMVDLVTRAWEKLDRSRLDWRCPRCTMVSSVTNKPVSDGDLTPNYWASNLTGKVRFSDAVSTLYAMPGHESIGCYVEVGPHSALSGPFKQICQGNQLSGLSYIPTLIRNKNSATQLLSTAGQLFIEDYPVDLERVNEVESPELLYGINKGRMQPLTLVDLPKYSWNYDKTFWAEPRFSAEHRQPSHARHDLLGTRIPGLSERSMVWRNILRLKDVPWLNDHKLGGSIMFPAAGHMALAIEATRQYCEIRDIAICGLKIRDLELKTALIIPEGDNGLEIQLRLARNNVSSETSPTFAFFVESYANEVWNLHSQGMIAPITSKKGFSEPIPHPVNVGALSERHTGKRWNHTFKRVGFEYGGSFSALEKIRTHEKHYEAAGEIPITTISGQLSQESRYVLHPSTVDCLLQLCIISIHAGLYQDMPWGVIPVKFEEVSLWFPEASDEGVVGHAVAWNNERGSRARRFNTDSQLMTHGDRVLLDIKGLHTVSYEAALPPSKGVQVQPVPYAGVAWKPDITMSPMDHAVASYQRDEMHKSSSLSATIDLLNHKKPVSNVLFLGAPSWSRFEPISQILAPSAGVNVVYGSQTERDELHEGIITRANLIELSAASVVPDGIEKESQDLIIIDAQHTKIMLESRSLEEAKGTLRHGGMIIFMCEISSKPEITSTATAAGFMCTEVGDDGGAITICTASSYANGHISEEALTLAYSRAHSPPPEGLAHAMSEEYPNIEAKDISDIDIVIDKKVVLYNTSGNLLSQLTPEVFRAITTLVPSGATVLWLTSGVNEGQCPQGALAQGFLRVVQEEQKMANVMLLDIDRCETFESISNAISAIFRLRSHAAQETEFWLHNGVCHVGRIQPTQAINDRMCPSKQALVETQLPTKQALRTIFRDGEVLFQASDASTQPHLGADEVEVQVDALQFDKRDMQAEVEVPRLISGTIIRTGSKTSRKVQGQHVVALVSDPYQTIIRAPARLCAECNPADATALISILPSIFKALNSLQRANSLLERQHVVLLPTSKPLVDAYVTLSKAIGFQLSLVQHAEVYHQCSYPQVEGIAVVNSTDVPAIRRLIGSSKSHSPSVVIASEFTPFTQEIWRSIRPSGSFVLSEAAEDSLDVSPELTPFTRGATFSSTSVGQVFKSDPEAVGDLLQKAMEMLQSRIVAIPPKTTADSLTIVETSPESAGNKTVLSYPYDSELIKVLPTASQLRFDSEHCYLLVGCLGGLGRSLTSWMMSRGARHFAFISRSAADKPDAARLIESITNAGAKPKVFRGDASNVHDVRRIVQEVAAERPIKGVVHAAMVLEDAMLGSTMTHSKFRACLAPKVDGARALHDALAGHALDFFVLTSSISAVIGQPGQSNYAAANAFLDAFALQRRRAGLPATSLALPMVLGVGVVAENEGLEDKIARRGLYGVDEREMLRGFEAAMSQPLPPPSGTGVHDHANAALIMGLEPSRLAGALGGKDTTDTAWSGEARFTALGPLVAAAGATLSASGGSGGGAAEFLANVAAAHAGEGGRDVAIAMVAKHVMAKCGSILMLDVDTFEMEGSSIGGYGLDSMIGAELRNWLYSEFGLNIAFQELLATTLTFKGLGGLIVESLAL